MTDDIAARLEQLSRRTAAVTDLVAAMCANGPRDTDGLDATGTVRVTLGPDGLPSAVRIVHNWRQSISPESLGRAVMDASAAAVTKNMDAWSQTLGQLPWRAQVTGPRTGDNQHVNEPPPPAPYRSAPEFTELTEHVLRSLAEVRRRPNVSPPVNVGNDSSRNVSIALSPTRLESCNVEPAWAAHQSGYGLTAALSQALAAARTALAEREDQRRAGGAHDFVAEALNALTRFCAEAEESTRRSL
jgi:hypothetical protein